MYLVFFVLMGILLAVPVAMLSWLVGFGVVRIRPGVDARRVRRTAALVIGAAVVIAMALPGAGWYAITFIFPACLMVGLVVGCAAIEWSAKRIVGAT